MNSGLIVKFMHNNSPSLYCCSLHQKPPRYQVTQGKLINVLAGASAFDEGTKQQYRDDQWLMDDVGENISPLNSIFGDLTVLYWMWKNADDDFLGICQYRRPWIEEDVVNSDDGVLYVPEPALFGNMRHQYESSHGTFPAYQFSIDLANRKRIPLTVDMLEYAWNQGVFHGCNMARGPKWLFDRYCELVFETMMPFYEENMNLCESLQGYQRRSIAFVAERMITTLLIYRNHFFGEGKVKDARIGFTG